MQNITFFTCTYILRRFLHGSGFFADPDPDSGKKSDPENLKNTPWPAWGTY